MNQEILQQQPAVSQAFSIKSPHLGDAEAIHHLINHFAQRDLLLRRSLKDIKASMDQFVVAAVNKKHTGTEITDIENIGTKKQERHIIGCASLYRYDNHLYELRSLCVEEDFQGTGVAQALTEMLIHRATHEVHAKTLILFTAKAGIFFERLGFKSISRAELNQKVLDDCKACICYKNCRNHVYQLSLSP